MLHSGNSQKDMGYFTVTLGYVGIDGDKKSDRLLLLVSPHFPLRLVRPSAHTGIVFDLSFSCHFGANSLNSKSLSFPLLFFTKLLYLDSRDMGKAQDIKDRTTGRI